MPSKLLALAGVAAFLYATFLLSPVFTYAAVDHPLISEVQLSAESANDEFIELYNPTDSDVDISNWSIQRQTTGNAFAKKNFTSGATIASHGYYLIAHSDFDTLIPSADMAHASFTLSGSGCTIFLVSSHTQLSSGNEAEIIDKLAIGDSALNPEGSSFIDIPADFSSLERKAQSSSTSTTMSFAGDDEIFGNGYDSDNNNFDFVLRGNSQPQNSQSEKESPPETSPSTSPTLTPVSPTPSSTPLPTIVKTPTPTAQLQPADYPYPANIRNTIRIQRQYLHKIRLLLHLLRSSKNIRIKLR